MTKKVLVLGGSGMLGSMITDYLARDPELEVRATAQTEALAALGQARLPEIRWELFDASLADTAMARELLSSHDWIVNAIGIIKPLIHDDNAAEVERAVRVNALFPHALARLTEGGGEVLQIATDCVYTGAKGRYVEGDPHDALDVYGKTKSLGEVYAPQVHHLRCSIIGPEPKAPKSLMEWFLGQAQGAQVGGYVNHDWNGVTTLHFAKLCHGIIQRHLRLPHLQHIVPAGAVTKHELLQLFARHYGRADVTIKPTEAGTVIDRTLTTTDETLNCALWQSAGYATPPSVPEMVAELAQFNYRMASGRLGTHGS